MLLSAMSSIVVKKKVEVWWDELPEPTMCHSDESDWPDNESLATVLSRLGMSRIIADFFFRHVKNIYLAKVVMPVQFSLVTVTATSKYNSSFSIYILCGLCRSGRHCDEVVSAQFWLTLREAQFLFWLIVDGYMVPWKNRRLQWSLTSKHDDMGDLNYQNELKSLNWIAYCMDALGSEMAVTSAIHLTRLPSPKGGHPSGILIFFSMVLLHISLSLSFERFPAGFHRYACLVILLGSFFMAHPFLESWPNIVTYPLKWPPPKFRKKLD